MGKGKKCQQQIGIPNSERKRSDEQYQTVCKIKTKIPYSILPTSHKIFGIPILDNNKATWLDLVSKELNHLAAILHVYAGGLNFMK